VVEAVEVVLVAFSIALLEEMKKKRVKTRKTPNPIQVKGKVNLKINQTNLKNKILNKILRIKEMMEMVLGKPMNEEIVDLVKPNYM
jgi:hypothetical protein